MKNLQRFLASINFQDSTLESNIWLIAPRSRIGSTDALLAAKILTAGVHLDGFLNLWDAHNSKRNTLLLLELSYTKPKI